MKNKNINLELIRVIACIFVIIIHVSNYYRRGFLNIDTSSYLFSLLINIITRVSVPLFFMLSGALLLGRENDLKNNKRIFNSMFILFVWSIIYFLWEIYFKGNSFNLINILYKPTTKHLWFMYAIVGIYIALPYLQKLFNNTDKKMDKNFIVIWFLIMLFTFVSSFFNKQVIYEIPIIGQYSYYFCYFILGYLIFKYKDDLKKKFTIKKSIFILISSIIITFIIGIYIQYNTNYIEKFLQYRNFLIIISSTFIFYLLNVLDIKFNNKIISLINNISKYSLGIYLIHILFLDIFKRIGFMNIHSIIGIPLFSLIIFILSIFSIILIKKIPYLKKIC